VKLVVQIPCLNEEKTLPLVLKGIPKKIPGIDIIQILIIDDGSSDNTIQVAKELGVKEFIIHSQRMGLARSFRDGLNRALELGADIVVNTDGDNQYPQAEIANLVRPILDGEAEIVIADRQTNQIDHFSFTKKMLQKMGSRAVNIAAGTNLPDAASGFRAYSKASILRLNIVTTFSYAMETIIQAGNKKIPITSIPIKTNPKLRESRLFKSSFEHVRKSGTAIIRAFIMYKPYIIFNGLGILFLALGVIPFIRFLILLGHKKPGNHIQSLIFGSVLLIASFLSFSLGIIADLIRINRSLHEETLELIKDSKFKGL
jgi:glycosyltransferase involved in cell wall biosynthesis